MAISAVLDLRAEVADRRRMRHRLLGSNGPRRYLVPHLTLDSFFAVLNERGVPYAVLRWFEQLPQVDPGEDIDLLVADEHLEFLHTLLVPRPASRSSQAFDIYTVSGLPGTDFGGGVPYYPPQFAADVLAHAELLRDRYRVPDPEHHFLSLAYHAVYHKGYPSGLPSETRPDRAATTSDHDYEAVLTNLAARLGLQVAPTLEALDALLAERNLRPPLDTLERLAPGNRWIDDRFLVDRPEVDDVWRGLAVFVVRERADDDLDLIRKEIDRHGFEVLEVLRLDAAQRDRAVRRIRGGNWARGPWPLSGGDPSTFVIAYDVAPWSAVPGSPSSDNLRIPEAKLKIRDRLLDVLEPSERYNPLHSSDNPRQALDYLDTLAAPEVVTRTRKAAAALVEACRVPFPVVRHLTANGPQRRAQVALVDHPVHGRTVCKVYRPGARRFFERELEARRELADLPLVPELVEHGDNWLLTRFYENDGRQVQRRLPFATEFENAVQLRPEASRALAGFARSLHERGYFILDLTTENLFSDPRAGLKIVDLEFLQRFHAEVPLAESYTFRGIPAALRNEYDAPQDVPLTDIVGNAVFHPAVAGLPIEVLLSPPQPGEAARCRSTQLAWYASLGVQRPVRRLPGTVGKTRSGRIAKRVVKKAITLTRSRTTS